MFPTEFFNRLAEIHCVWICYHGLDARMGVATASQWSSMDTGQCPTHFSIDINWWLCLNLPPWVGRMQVATARQCLSNQFSNLNFSKLFKSLQTFFDLNCHCGWFLLLWVGSMQVARASQCLSNPFSNRHEGVAACQTATICFIEQTKAASHSVHCTLYST